jgi:hypothetical protein
MAADPTAGEVVLASIAATVFLSTAVGADAVEAIAAVDDGAEIEGFVASSLVAAVGAELPEFELR